MLGRPGSSLFVLLVRRTVFVLVMALLSLMTAPLGVVVVRAQDNVNEACASETADLNSDPVIQEAIVDLKDTVLAAVQDDFYQFCSILQRACTVDLDSYSGQLQSNCTAAGGQIATSQAELECRGKVLGVPIPGGVRVEFVNIPACVGTSCDVSGNLSSLPAAVEDTIDQALTQVEGVVESGLDDGNCTAAVLGIDSAAAAASTSWFVTVASAALVVVASLLAC